MTTLRDLTHVVPETGLSISNDAHCQRVARLAGDIGQRLGLSSATLRTLGEAAIQHHSMELLWPAISSPRGCSGTNELRESLETLLFFHGVEKPEPGSRSALLAEILHLANSFDEEFEWRIFEGSSGSRLIDEIATLTRSGLWSAPVHEAFRAIFAGNRDRALTKAEDLPLSVVSKVQKLALLSADELTIEGLEQIALTDPVLSADLLRHRNSAKYPGRDRVCSVRQAITFIGTVESRKVMLASAARGIFASSSLHRLWKHSVRCAEKMSLLAIEAGLDPNQAFLLGLLHDIGRISLDCLDSTARSGYTQLCKTEAPAIWMETATAGCDHAELGADILTGWNLPETIVNGVRHHHSPDQSQDRLTSLLYLVENTEDDNEDLASPRQVNLALAQLELTPRQLDRSATSEQTAFAC